MRELAINGGKPIRNTYLAYGKQTIDDDDIDNVVSVLKGEYLTTGPIVNKFENSILNYVGSKYAVAVSNGTAALHMACHVAGISKGDEVLVPAITFAASSNCVLYCGGTPVFVDVDPYSYNINVNEIKKKINDKTKAIIVVDFAGQSVDMDSILQIAEEYNLIVIEDAAHAFGSEYKNKKVGIKAHMTTFSFHPVKPITTGEGGAVVTNSKELYEKMLLFRSHGITRNCEFMTENQGPWYYEQIDLGYNYRLTDIQSALGLSQIKKIDKFIKKRREIVKIYNENFKDIDEIVIPFEYEYSKSGYHIYVLLLNLNKLKCDRKTIFEALQAENIGVNVHYLPVYLHPYYRELGYKKGSCPIAEDIYNKMITIPLFPSMSNKDIEDVIKAVKKVINYYRK
ncbi:UDP-4-amino-4,6-dideoxy-N-acetyl-beta-L-altrosamine transaminase [Clostridium sp. CAG:265]|uniref:UDP-4-amino-4, 6-dideoxy-N-acetyl-beta-L-altrosamine transaminase n=1 Tax=Clostridium sp. CAG:265 TaxID=1262787 RepID=UPI00033A2F81|nr:UDP-4-amino-4,6-dideoxy-N-acetyl-beta-L-altrosamine transaminase [Clostridium sp. CAG:265]CDB75734.1 putative LPS biosynthesis-related protein [Clostridium sp. CAG:265]